MSRTLGFVLALADLVEAVVTSSVDIGPIRPTEAEATVLQEYSISDDTDTGDSLIAVQVLLRRNKQGDLIDAQDAVFDLLTAIRMTTIGGVPVSMAWRQISPPRSLDEHGRYEARDSYYFNTDRSALA